MTPCYVYTQGLHLLLIRNIFRFLSFARNHSSPPYGHTTTAMHEIEYISPIEYTPPRANQLVDTVIHMQENPSQKRFLTGRSSPFVRLAEHLTALRAWCKQCLPGP